MGPGPQPRLEALDPVLAVDGGQSSTRVAVVRGGRPGPVGVGPGAPAPSRPDGPQRIAEAIAQGCHDLGVDPRGLPLAAGLTGLAEAAQQSEAVAGALRAHLEVDRVRLAGDLVTAHLGALGGEPGAVVAAGTGAVALAVARHGASARVDGWGFLVGDDGSGFAVGRAGLRAALWSLDGRGEATDLTARAEQRYGALEGLPARLHAERDPAGAVAAFARDVGGAATQGDAQAAAILRAAATELARSVTTAVQRAPSAEEHPVVVGTGGLFAIGPALTEPFTHEVAARLPGAEVREPVGAPLDGARLLARGPRAHASLVLHDR